MATTIDERIVAAKFDASDFEKGVDKTIKKLDELKKSFNLENATKGVKELAEKAEASTDSMSKSLEKLTDRFTSFTGMIKQKILSGLADEVAGVFFKMEQSVKNFIRTISTAQISAGMAKYEQILTSVRVMMSAGDSEKSAYEAIDKLQLYSDQTSYSLSQMTDALSKLRAAGVGLEDARKSVEGIANACANAGVNATDAGRAFYNLAQAYSKGNLNYTDYKSLELLNMTTKKFKETMLEAAVQAGTLKKISDGVYETINKTDKKVAAGKKVTLDNAADMLRYNYMNKEAMNELFGKKFYFDEEEFRRYKNNYVDKVTGELSDEDREKAIADAKKDFGELAVDAYLAAREARSFTDVLNTLKDAVSTGWSTSFTYLFGQLEQAKKFFTDLTEGGLADIIYKIGEYRNTFLSFWSGPDAEGNAVGAKLFEQTILNVSDALGTLLRTVLQILPGFDELNNTEEEGTPTIKALAERFQDFTADIRDWSVKIKQASLDFNRFMNSPIVENGPTRIELLRSTFANLLNVFSIAGRAISIAFSGVSKILTALHPVFDGLLIVLEKITEPITNFKNNEKVFKGVEATFTNLSTVIEKVAKPLGTVVGFLAEVAGFFVQMAVDTATANITFFTDFLGLILELIGIDSGQKQQGEGVIDGIRKEIEGIVEVCSDGLGAVREFFDALLSDLRELFGLSNEHTEDGNIFSRITNFFETNEFVQDAKKWIKQAFIDIGDFIKDIPNKVWALSVNIYDTIWNMLFKEETKYNGSQLETKVVKTELGEWVDNAIKDIKEFVASIPQRIIDGIGTIGNWIDAVFDSIFGEKKNEQAEAKKETESSKDDKGKEKSQEAINRFNEFVDSITVSIKEWFNDLPNKIRKSFKSIGNFFTKVIGVIEDFLFGKKEKVKEIDEKGKYKFVTRRVKTGFSKWLDSFIKDIGEFIKKIPEYIKLGIKGTGDIITSIVNAIFGKNETSGDTQAVSKEVQDKIEQPFLGIDWDHIWTVIKGIGEEIFNQIARIFTGSEDININKEWFAGKVSEAIDWIRVKAQTALDAVLEFLPTIPTRIAEFFTGEADKKTVKEGNGSEDGIGAAIARFGEMIGGFIESIPDTILEFVNNAIKAFDDIWTKLYNGIMGLSKKEPEIIPRKPIDIEKYPVLWEKGEEKKAVEQTKSGWEQFVEKLGSTVSLAFEKLPKWIADGLTIAVGAIGEIISKIGTWLGGVGTALAEETKDSSENAMEEAVEGVKKGTEEEPELVTAIKKLGEKLFNLFTEIIPNALGGVWSFIFGIGAQVWEGLKSLFNGTEPDGDIATAVNSLGNKLKEFFEGLPDKLEGVWNTIFGVGAQVWEGLKSIFDGTVPDSDIGKAVSALGSKIETFIKTDIPEYIKRAFDFIGKLINGDKTLLGPKLNLKNKNKNDDDFHVLVEELKDRNKKAKDEVEKPGFWSFADGIGESIKKAFANIGPTVFNGLASAFDFLGNVVDFVVKHLTGEKSISEQVDEAYEGEEPELITSLKKIGESIKKFFLESLPELFGAVFGYVSAHASEWFKKIFGAMSKGQEKAKKDIEAKKKIDDVSTTEEAMEAASGAFEFIRNFINNLSMVTLGNGLEVIAILVLIAVIIGKISNIFSAAEVLEGAGYAMKWVALTVAFAAIGGLLAFLQDLTKNGNETQMSNAERIFDKLIALFEKLAWVVGFIAGGKLFDMIGEIFGNSKAKKELLNSGLISGSEGGIFSLFTSFFSTAAKTIGFGVGADISTKLFSSAGETGLNFISTAFSSILYDTEQFVAGLTPIIGQLEGMNSKLDGARESVRKIVDMFAGFYTMLDDMFVEVANMKTKRSAMEDVRVTSPSGFTGDADSMPFSDVLMGDDDSNFMASLEVFKKEIGARLALYMEMSIFLDRLASSINKIGNISDMQEKLNNFKDILDLRGFGNGENRKPVLQEIFTTLFSILDAAFYDTAMSGKSNFFGVLGTTDGSVIMSAATSFSILGDALEVLGGSLSNMSKEKVDALAATMELIYDLIHVFDKGTTDLVGTVWDKIFKGETTLAVVGREIKSFAVNVQGVFDSLKDAPGFDTDAEVKKTTNKVHAMGELISALAYALTTAQSSSEYFSSLTSIGEGIGAIGPNLVKFYTDISEGFDEKGTLLTEKRISIINTMVTSFSQFITGLSDIVNANQNLANAGTENPVLNLLDAMMSSITQEGYREKLGASVIAFNIALADIMKSEEYTDPYYQAGSTIAGRIYDGIQSAFDNNEDYLVKISPVLELDNAKQQLIDFFGLGTIEDFNLSSIIQSITGANNNTDNERVKASELYRRLTNIEYAVNHVNPEPLTVADLTTAFTGIKIVTNTDVLAGEMVDTIDEMIGAKIILIENNVTP